MKLERLTDIKKELKELNNQQLNEICLSLAKLRKENKEFLNYLLVNASDQAGFAEDIKTELLTHFLQLPDNQYKKAKAIRKIISLLSKYNKFMRNQQLEVELSLWFINQLILNATISPSHKSVCNIVTRQLDKTGVLIQKLHEDLQFDYLTEFERLKYAVSCPRETKKL